MKFKKNNIPKIVLAPDSFRGSLSAVNVCKAMDDGIRKVYPKAEIISIPLSDGGEGFVDSMLTANKGKYKECTAFDPLGNKIIAKYGVLESNKMIVIEMAATSGLQLLPKEKQNPLLTTTFGTGQIILDAMISGYKDFFIGIGGSATNDCGAGMAQALGVKFFQKDGLEIKSPMNGKLLGESCSFNMDGISSLLKDCTFTIASDVTNPLLGENGATYVYSPQKGATPDSMKLLENNMKHFIDIVEKELNICVRNQPGAGAAGGLGAALMAFLGAEMKSGIDIVLQKTGFEEKIKNADLIITGEGKIDSQTAQGKTISGILKIAWKNEIPVIGICGIVEGNPDELYKLGMKKILPIIDSADSQKQSISKAAFFITRIVEGEFR